MHGRRLTSSSSDINKKLNDLVYNVVASTARTAVYSKQKTCFITFQAPQQRPSPTRGHSCHSLAFCAGGGFPLWQHRAACELPLGHAPRLLRSRRVVSTEPGRLLTAGHRKKGERSLIGLTFLLGNKGNVSQRFQHTAVTLTVGGFYFPHF